MTRRRMLGTFLLGWGECSIHKIGHNLLFLGRRLGGDGNCRWCTWRRWLYAVVGLFGVPMVIRKLFNGPWLALGKGKIEPWPRYGTGCVAVDHIVHYVLGGQKVRTVPCCL